VWTRLGEVGSGAGMCCHVCDSMSVCLTCDSMSVCLVRVRAVLTLHGKEKMPA